MAEDAILGYLEKNEEIPDSGKFAEEFGIDHDEIVNVTKSLNAYGLVLSQVSVSRFIAFVKLWNSLISLKLNVCDVATSLKLNYGVYFENSNQLVILVGIYLKFLI